MLTAYDSGNITGKGTLDGSLLGRTRAHADIELGFWHAAPLRFNAEADAIISVLDLFNVYGQLLVSDRGAAACVNIGADFGFLGDWELNIGGAISWPFSWDVMFGDCDIGVERDAPPAMASARQQRADAAGYCWSLAMASRSRVANCWFGSVASRADRAAARATSLPDVNV